MKLKNIFTGLLKIAIVLIVIIFLILLTTYLIGVITGIRQEI